MQVSEHSSHPAFAAEITGVELRGDLDDGTIAQIAGLLDRYAVAVFRDQRFTDEEQVAFGKRLGTTQESPSRAKRQRLASREVSDVSNLDENEQVITGDDTRRLRSIGNRLWHSDGSFQIPRAEYSMLHARIVTSTGGETEYADLRAAFDSLAQEMQAQLRGLSAEHNHVLSRERLGFTDFSPEVEARFPPVVHPVVQTHPGSKRETLYLGGSHASHIVGWPIPEGRILLYDLVEHATKPQFVYRHRWRAGDLVIWDNRCTMHRARPFDEREARDLRKVTTVDDKLQLSDRRSEPVRA